MKKRIPDRQDTYIDKSLPHSDESERVCLGAVLLDNELITQIASLSTEDFYSPINRRVFEAMISLFAQSKEINPVLISEELKKEGPLEAIGGIPAIANLTFGLPYFSDLTEYIRTIREKSTLRKLIRQCTSTASEAISETIDVSTILDQHEHALYALRGTETGRSFRSAGAGAARNLAEIRKRAQAGEEVLLGIPSGFKDLDNMTAGYQKTDLIITAGRPSMGKTALALMGCLNATAYNPDWVIGIFSLEMSEDQINNRLLCAEAHVNSGRYRIGHLMQKEWERVAYASEVLQKRHIYVDDTPHLSVMEMKARARKLRTEKKRLDLIVVDHLGHVKGSGRNEKRLEIGEITKALKGLAKEMNIPVRLLCQLTRAPEKRADNKPMLSDLAESGEIEQDADVVELIFRGEYYKETEENKGIAEIIVAKNRNGPIGTVKLTFLKEFMRFENLYG